MKKEPPIRKTVGDSDSLPLAGHMKFSLRHEDSHANSTEYEWHMNVGTDKSQGGPRFHYLFVEDGMDPKYHPDEPACPVSHPDLAWTASTSEDYGGLLPAIPAS